MRQVGILKSLSNLSTIKLRFTLFAWGMIYLVRTPDTHTYVKTKKEAIKTTQLA